MLCGCQLAGFGKKDRVPEGGANKNPCFVLALPASGPYAPLGRKIGNGARLAVEEMKATGVNARLETIDTEASGWLARLEGLPEECAIVGGPLQEKAYLSAKKAGLLEKRVFFAFLPSLQQGEEGMLAWRFFPAPHDQVDALSRFGMEEMNINSYGAFYPDDNYGKKMTDLFEKNLSSKNIPLKKASYNPKVPSSFKNAAATLINPEKIPPRYQPIPRTDFEAIFLPDSWKNMDAVTNALIANGEDRLILMGSTLWEPQLSGKAPANAAKYELAVFPGARNESKAPKKLRDAKADFWGALGYDFANFAAWIGLTARVDPVIVTTMAQKASPKIRGMAPISWNNAGRASQSLYIFQVTPQGAKPVNPELLKRTRTAIHERAALRYQGIRDAQFNTPVEEEPIVSANPVAEEPAPQPTAIPRAAPARPDAPPLSNVPQSSYKLRLPSKK